MRRLVLTMATPSRIPGTDRAQTKKRQQATDVVPPPSNRPNNVLARVDARMRLSINGFPQRRLPNENTLVKRQAGRALRAASPGL